MSRLEIHMNEFKRVFRDCNPQMKEEGDGIVRHLVRTECILHKYLVRTTVGRRTNFAGCIGGPICIKITTKLGLGNHTDCETIHKIVYDLIKKNFRTTVRI